MINFDQKIKDMWNEHAKNTDGVISAFDEALTLAHDSEQIKKLIQLVVHIYTDHKLDNAGAVSFLNRVQSTDSEVINALNNSKNIFKVYENPQHNIFDEQTANQVKILAGAVSLSVFAKNYQLGLIFLRTATELAQSLPKEDLANKNLAITGNNVACALEEKMERTPAEAELMILAAKTGREFWEKAGTWLETERAEYRLSQSYLKNRDFISSIKHANLCITICEKNNAPALEFFYAYEAVAHVEKAMGQPLRSLEKMKNHFNDLSEDDKKWCSPALEFFMK